MINSIDFSMKPGHAYGLLYLSMNMFLLTAMGKTQNSLVYCIKGYMEIKTSFTHPHAVFVPAFPLQNTNDDTDLV